MTVTVYTKPRCVQCDATKRKLKDLGVAFDEQPIDESVLLRAVAAGITAAPVVEAIGFAPFGGYRPDRLAEIANVAAVAA